MARPALSLGGTLERLGMAPVSSAPQFSYTGPMDEAWLARQAAAEARGLPRASYGPNYNVSRTNLFNRSAALRNRLLGYDATQSLARQARLDNLFTQGAANSPFANMSRAVQVDGINAGLARRGADVASMNAARNAALGNLPAGTPINGLDIARQAASGRMPAGSTPRMPPPGPLYGPFPSDVVEGGAGKPANSLLGQMLGKAPMGGLKGYAASNPDKFLGKAAGFATKNMTRSGVTGMLAGLPVSMGIDALNIGGEDSAWDKYLSAAGGGAAGGAVVGGLPGALIGGALGLGVTGLIDLLDGDGEGEIDHINDVAMLAKEYGLPREQTDMIRQAYKVNIKLGGMSEQKALKEAMSTARTMVLEAQSAAAAEEQAAVDPEQALMLQLQTAEILAPYAERMRSDAANYSTMFDDSPLGRSLADSYARQANNMADASMMSAIASPIWEAALQQADDLNAMSRQIQQQAQSAAMRPAESSSSSFSDLISQMTG